MADQWREHLSGSVTARMLLQQPIPVFDRVRKFAHSSADFFEILGASAHCRADDPRIAALTIRELPHGRPRIAARLPSEYLCGVSAEKVSFPCHVPYCCILYVAVLRSDLFLSLSDICSFCYIMVMFFHQLVQTICILAQLCSHRFFIVSVVFFLLQSLLMFGTTV